MAIVDYWATFMFQFFVYSAITILNLNKFAFVLVRSLSQFGTTPLWACEMLIVISFSKNDVIMA